MHSISGIWKSSFLFAVVAAAILAFSVPAFAAPDINRVAFEGNSKVKTETLRSRCARAPVRRSIRSSPRPTSRA